MLQVTLNLQACLLTYEGENHQEFARFTTGMPQAFY
jgi:hypothetical protein